VPIFEKENGSRVKAVAVGTGQALALAGRGEADVVLAHAPDAEKQYVADGTLVNRRLVMHNTFLLAGPAADLAGVKGTAKAIDALRKISGAKATFVSRGDDSGTHKLELSLWKAAGVDVSAASGTWYREAGAGMGATLNTASGLEAYSLTDRGTWISFKNRGNLAILSEGDSRLFNQYGVMLVNSTKHPHVKATDGQRFIDWLLSDKGQQAIAAFRIEGEQAFFPNARKSGS